MADCEEDNIFVRAGLDLEIAWMTNNIVPKCENELDLDNCGIFIEIHMPAKKKILKEIKILEYISNGFKTLFINTSSLCAGKYEFWVVLRIKDVNYLIYVKQFMVVFPSCICDYVKSLNYTCLVK